MFSIEKSEFTLQKMQFKTFNSEVGVDTSGERYLNAVYVKKKLYRNSFPFSLTCTIPYCIYT